VLARHRNRNDRFARIVAVFALAIFAAVQFASISHYHPMRPLGTSAGHTQVGADDSCPICLHHSHATPAVSAAPSYAHLEFVCSASARAKLVAFACEFRYRVFGRAPPATV